MVEHMGLKIITSRSPSIASAPYKILSRSTYWFRSSYGEGTNAGWLLESLLFIFG
jgi:hypothetical protein